MQYDTFLSLYDASLPTLHARGEALRDRIESWLRAGATATTASGRTPKVHSVTYRIKSRSSLSDKLARPDRSYQELWDVTDLVGLRVITYFEDGVDRVGQLIEEKLPVVFEHSIDKRRRGDHAAFGYRSLHYVCRLIPEEDTLSGEIGLVPAHVCCEIQVRTVLEHAWAEIEHDLGYKTDDAIPVIARRRLSRLAGLLELADQEFVAIRRDLHAYAETLPKQIEAESDSVPLDRMSLLPLLECAEVRDVDLAIAKALGKELGDEPFFPEYLLKMLASSGLRTVADVRRGVAHNANAIVSMVEPYFAFASRTWSLSPDQMARVFRGYSLFFLAHVEVLRSGSLGIDKVQRLTHLYRTLDYPDDERAAAQVASLLVEAFDDLGAFA